MNRDGLQRHLLGLIEEAEKSGTRLSVAILDLDGFKSVNDRFGHPAGDDVLRGVARLIDESRVADDAFRIGGDEFAVLIPGGRQRGEAVTKGAAEALTARGPSFDLGAAWGAAAIPGEAAGPNEAMQLADVRMYAQKESRRIADEPSPELDVSEVEVRLGPARDGETV